MNDFIEEIKQIEIRIFQEIKSQIKKLNVTELKMIDVWTRSFTFNNCHSIDIIKIENDELKFYVFSYEFERKFEWWDINKMIDTMEISYAPILLGSIENHIARFAK